VNRIKNVTEESESTSRGIGDAWSSMRGLLQSYSTQGIKEILGKAGLPVFKIQYDGTYKGSLLDEADKLVMALDTESRGRVVLGCVEEVVALERNKATRMSKRELQPDNQILNCLEKVLARIGFGLSGDTVFPISLQLDIETASLPTEVNKAIAEALHRYRDGRFAGAVTSICGAVDQITERAFSTKALGNHKDTSYQERISRSFAALEGEYCRPLKQTKLPSGDVKLIWENHRKSVAQAGYVLAALRREFSDAHGQQNAPREFVQKSLDCAVFVLRSFCGILNQTSEHLPVE